MCACTNTNTPGYTIYIYRIRSKKLYFWSKFGGIDAYSLVDYSCAHRWRKGQLIKFQIRKIFQSVSNKMLT